MIGLRPLCLQWRVRPAQSDGFAERQPDPPIRTDRAGNNAGPVAGYRWRFARNAFRFPPAPVGPCTNQSPHNLASQSSPPKRPNERRLREPEDDYPTSRQTVRSFVFVECFPAPKAKTE